MTPMFEAAAEKLRAAYVEGAIAPLRDILEPTDTDGAYAVQDINTQRWIADGRRLIGRKIGLTAEAVQKQLGVDQPDFGALFSDMRIVDGGVLKRSSVLQPKAEAEVAIVLGKDIEDPSVDADGILSATSHAIAAIEIVDSRIADWKITFADTVADNGSSAFFVLGSSEVPIEDLDLYSCGMVLEVNGQIASIGAGAACLGHPLNAAAWLARTLIARGEPLRAGDILMTGALGPMVALKPGDKVRAVIGGLGECSFEFEGDSE
ncbi:2-keto-4-pentenoate hydratase [Sphingobium chungbukense]|uniref:2-keto-4-pentenoate hydratase n=1 Tax=Sphingobium chungbukense TaxID=56193 RepID=A0A0M3AJ78_9SPHN|nr:fumarylacetoacetate hydrolase family protein [Sphingobium chungbukense]KKW90147.1 2-keto-4-pentenoate hydratase [Sphingobium chungbukense]